jgi:hypothetical protein
LLWFCTIILWPLLTRPQSTSQFAAAAYLQLLFAGITWLMWRAAARPDHEIPVLADIAALASSDILAATSPAPQAAPKNWWADTGTRSEVQEAQHISRR